MGVLCPVPFGLLRNAAAALSLVSSREVAIDFDSLRAAIRIWQQRITPINWEYTLTKVPISREILRLWAPAVW